MFSLRFVASSGATYEGATYEGATYEWEGPIMSKSEVSAPVSSAASARMALGVSWVRPGAGSIDGALSPSNVTIYEYRCDGTCFAGNEE